MKENSDKNKESSLYESVSRHHIHLQSHTFIQTLALDAGCVFYTKEQRVVSLSSSSFSVK